MVKRWCGDLMKYVKIIEVTQNTGNLIVEFVAYCFTFCFSDTSDVAIKEDPCHQFPSDFEVHLASAEQIDILRSVDEVIDVHKIHNR